MPGSVSRCRGRAGLSSRKATRPPGAAAEPQAEPCLPRFFPLSLAGGVAASALLPPRQFLGAARNVEGGGSLTILSTALVDTGSRLDDVLFEEFKGTGNMELRLRRELAEKRIFPAIDPMPSGTRHDELLMSAAEYQAVGRLRRALGALKPQQALELLLDKTHQTASNAEFLRQIQRSG